MDVQKALRDARVLMNMHGLRGWTLELDRGKRRAGATHFPARKITLSRYLTELHSESEVRNTILHEIAHAIAGFKAGHGPAWRRVAVSIGCTGQRCHNGETVPPRWEGTCPRGHTYHRHTLQKKVRDHGTCPRCSPTHDPRYRLVWVDRGSQVR